MSDYNKILSDVQKKGMRLEKDIKDLLVAYDNFYRDVSHDFTEERARTGSMDGLGEFYKLVHTLRRNRDVVSSMMRATKGLRSLREFKVIEEISENVLDEEKISEIRIPEEAPIHEEAKTGKVNA